MSHSVEKKYKSFKSHSAKNVKGNSLGFFNIHSVAKCQKIEGGSLGDIKNFPKMSHSAEKIERSPLVSSAFVVYARKKEELF